MAITDLTLRTQSEMRQMADDYVDASTRAVTARWAQAWNELSLEWQAIISVILSKRAAGEPLTPMQILQLNRVRRALTNTGATLQELSNELAPTLRPAMKEIVDRTAALTDDVIRSQLPSGNQVAIVFPRTDQEALAQIIERSLGNVVSSADPLPGEQLEAVKSSLIRAVPSGWHPNVAAQEMLRRVYGSFSGGLARALRIARTEMLDAHRAANRQQVANNSAVTSVAWHAELGPRTCPSCLAKHGTEYPPGTPGPFDHPNGRCTFIPKTKSWADLGFPSLQEPADMFQSAEDWISANPEAAVSAMGAERYLMYQNGAVSLRDMSTRVDNPDWRPSYVATPLVDLRRKASS